MEKSLVASRSVCWITFLVVITKSVAFRCCAVSIRALEAVCSSKHQILKLFAFRGDIWRNFEILKFFEKAITGATQCPPGRRAGGSHPDGCLPTNEMWLVEAFECEATRCKATLCCVSGKVVVKK